MTAPLSSRLRPGVECAPWVIEEVRKLEANQAPALLATLDKCFEEEISRVSTVEYNSNEICRWFWKQLRGAVELAQSPEPAVVPTQQ